jgi:transmembrane sensor
MDLNERRERAHAEAAEWWLRLEAGPLSLRENEEFADWLRESAVHVAEMIKMGRLHSMLEAFPDWHLVATAEGREAIDSVVPFTHDAADQSVTAWTSPGKSADLRTRMRRRWWLGAALAAVATVATVTLWLSISPGADVIQTGRAERRGVTLVDGSLIQIDPQTRLRIEFKPHTRDVQLEEGRALFRVAKDPNRPFLVQAGATVVRAVGTQFGVERGRSGIVVTVASGKVAVFASGPAQDLIGSAGSKGLARTAGARGAPPPGRRRSNERESAIPGATTPGDADSVVFLTAGEQMTVAQGGISDPVKQVDSASALAWAEGRLVFENAQVTDVLEQFNRYNVIQLHVGDRQLASRSVHGVFDASEPESFISALQTVTAVRVDRRGLDITLFSGP